MQLLQQDPSRNLATLVKVFIVLGVLLIAVAAVILIGNFLGLLSKFKSELYLFILGAIIAYLMAPLVNLLQRVTRQRWAAVLCSYLLVLVVLVGFAAMLINPFISQAQSLVGNLHNPSAGSLGPLRQVRQDIARVQADFRASGQPGQSTKDDLAILAHHVTALTSPKTPTGAIQLPPSYIGPLLTQTNLVQVDYTQATAKSGPIDTALLARAVTTAEAAATAAASADQKASSTPLILLDLQTWLDNRGIQVDLHDKFGQALQQLNNQVASLVNNALGITLQAGNLLLSTVLALIISIYFLSDGGRFVRWLIRLLPPHSRRRASYFVIHLDQILGSYLRAQLVLALLAAILDASGAVIFGIPYPIVIFLSTFFLSLVPVIGPVILPFPPLLIALIFVPLPTPIFFLILLLVGEQFATNIVGPRLQAHNVGIHPLEAMAAALAGLPLAGLLGAFFAVPIVAFAHIVARGVVHAHRHEEPAPAGDSLGGSTQAKDAREPG